MKFNASNIKKKDPDIILWHYTSPEVFWQMLSGEFYATHYRFMNDSAEIIYGIQAVNDFFKNEESLQQLHLLIKDLLVRDFFLLCFSEDWDNLYHWRSYTPKGGFSIGFSYNGMCDLFNNIEYDSEDKLQRKERRNYDLVQCKYLPQVGIDNFFHTATADLKNAIEKLSREDKLLFDKIVAATISGNLSELSKLLDKSSGALEPLRDILPTAFRLQVQCPAFKNPSFEVEKEYRLIITGDYLRLNVEFIGNKPRIKIPTPELAKCIKGVYVSPHGDVEQNHLLAEIARTRFGLDFEIHHSESTFNGK